MTDYNEEEKLMLIESMGKLIEHIHDSKVHQAEIFKSLTTNDLMKILSNIEDSNPNLRKTSCRFLCELLYDNPQIQEAFCELTSLLPIDGKVCVNRIPEAFNPHMRLVPVILETIKNANYPPQNHGKPPVCWYFSSAITEGLQVQFIFPNDLDGMNPRLFIDPATSLFGFFIFNHLKQNSKSDNFFKSLDVSKSIDKKEQSFRSNQSMIKSQKVSPIKKRDTNSGIQIQNTSTGQIKKPISFNQSRNDRSFSDKKEGDTRWTDNSVHFGGQDSFDQYIQNPNFQNVQNNGVPPFTHQGDSSQNNSADTSLRIKTTSVATPKSEVFLKLKSSTSTNKTNYSLLERRKTSEGISDKSFKFKQTSTHSQKSQITSVNNSSGGSTLRLQNTVNFQQQPTTSYSKKRETSASNISNMGSIGKTGINSIHVNPSSSTSMSPHLTHGVKLRTFQLQPDTSVLPTNTSFERNKRIDTGSGSLKVTGYSLKDKRYSQPDEFQKTINSSNQGSSIGSSRGGNANSFSKSTHENLFTENNQSSPTPKTSEASLRRLNKYIPNDHTSINHQSIGSSQNHQSYQMQGLQSGNGMTTSYGGIFKKINANTQKNIVSKSLSIHSK